MINLLGFLDRHVASPHRYGEEIGPKDFFFDPKLLSRELSVIFSIGMLSSMVSENENESLSENTFWYGIVVSILAFLTASIFLLLDICYHYLRSLTLKKQINLSDIFFSSTLTIAHFILFCALVHHWRTNDAFPEYSTNKQDNEISFAVFIFAFLSVSSWIVCSILAWYYLKRISTPGRDSLTGQFLIDGDIEYTSFPTATELESPSHNVKKFVFNMNNISYPIQTEARSPTPRNSLIPGQASTSAVPSPSKSASLSPSKSASLSPSKSLSPSPSK